MGHSGGPDGLGGPAAARPGSPGAVRPGRPALATGRPGSGAAAVCRQPVLPGAVGRRPAPALRGTAGAARPGVPRLEATRAASDGGASACRLRRRRPRPTGRTAARRRRPTIRRASARPGEAPRGSRREDADRVGRDRRGLEGSATQSSLEGPGRGGPRGGRAGRRPGRRTLRPVPEPAPGTAGARDGGVAAVRLSPGAGAALATRRHRARGCGLDARRSRLEADPGPHRRAG